MVILMNRISRRLRLASCVAAACLLPAAVRGADPSADVASVRPPTTQLAPRGPQRLVEVPARWDFGPPPEPELQKAVAFLKENSPRRAAMVEAMVQSRYGLRRQIYMRYREMKVLEVEDPKLYDIKLRQLRVEDEMFGEAMAVRNPRQDSKLASEEHHQRLEKAAMDFVDLRIEERKHLIAKLQSAVAADEKDKRAAARQRMARELNGGPREGEFPGAPDGFNRPDAALPPSGP